MIFIIVLMFLSTYLFLYLLYHKIIFNYWKKKNVPFPSPTIVFGNIWEVITLRTTVGNYVQNLYRSYPNHPYVGFYVMSKPALLIRDAELIKDILIKDFEYFQDNWYTVCPEVDPLLACSPFVQKGRKWKEARAITTPQFTGAKVKAVFSSIKKVCANMIHYIDETQQNKKLNYLEATDLSARFTGENVMSCGYGLDAKSFLEKDPVTYILPGTVTDPLGLVISMKRTVGLLSVWAQQLFKITFAGNPTPNMFQKIIKNAVNERTEKNIYRNDFLNHLMVLRNKQRFDTNDLAGHAFTMYLDGFQTSFSAMAYALLEIALNSTIQDTARSEVYTVLEKYQGEISYEATQELQYLENILHESLRKHPIIKFMARKCTKTYQLKSSKDTPDLTIEKGTLMFISVRGIHYDSDYFMEPDKFDPCRFKEEFKKNIPGCSYLGFGAGPRICIGRRFAIAQIVAGMATILQHFDLKVNKKTRFPIKEDYFHISDIPISGIYIDFYKRSSTT